VLGDWTAEPFIGGVVSGTGADHVRLTAMLAQSIGPIHFAGEHTDPVYVTGMEGALRAGRCAADEILERRRVTEADRRSRAARRLIPRTG